MDYMTTSEGLEITGKARKWGEKEEGKDSGALRVTTALYTIRTSCVIHLHPIRCGESCRWEIEVITIANSVP